ncbi:hypothetical protein FSP39_012078 [Pinctada imbricata]|uniref:Uncharacterized protein n=1 Tax=Pinctada imbricata TaxID=66713 RepID=A0AA88Y083_PINIB|nr:hypothetical protein FSP39_012078 [Pinctada imbricata]
MHLFENSDVDIIMAELIGWKSKRKFSTISGSRRRSYTPVQTMLDRYPTIHGTHYRPYSPVVPVTMAFDYVARYIKLLHLWTGLAGVSGNRRPHKVKKMHFDHNSAYLRPLTPDGLKFRPKRPGDMRKLALTFSYRDFSEFFKREKEKVPDDSDKWLKPNTVRHRRISRLQQPLSHSHESLVALEHELTNHRLSSAGSVNNIANHVTEDEVKEEDIGRVAGWAVNFDKLLKDVSGLTVFTEFLKKEFSQENIVFWRAVEQYKQINDVDKRKAKAKEIFNTYISVKAADPINIEQTARQQVEKQLDSPSSNAFDRAQQEIFKLMKQDSYPRFIKSELYKSYLMREMEGKALNLPTEEEEEEDKNKGGKKEDKKKKGKDSEDKEKDKEKRRRSLLPWRHKNSKQSLKATSDTDLKKGSKEKDKMSVSASSVKEKEVNNNTQRKPASGPGIDLSTIRKEVQANTKELKEKEVEDKDVKFCRVILPDGSTTVVCTKPGQTIRAVLGKLCDKRGLSIAAVEVLFLGSDKPLDLSEDVSTLGSREVSIERRVLFRMDLANKKSIGVKAKPNRSVRDVFKPILNKYGFKIDSVTVQLAGQTGYVDIEEQVSTIDNQRVVVIPIESTPASNKRTATDTTSKRPPAVVKYPQDMHRWSAPDHSSSLNAITNCIFEDLMMGKYESAHNFDELGILDLTSKVKDHQKGTDDHRSSGLFGLLRKETPSAKLGLEQAKTKTKHKVTFNLQKNQTRRTDPDDDNFFDLLSKVQGDRMEDQRGVGTNDSDMPDFLRNTGLHSGRESAPPILTSRPERMMVDRGDYVQTENKDYISYTRGQISNRPSSVPVGQTDYVNSESNVDIVDGNSSFTYGNQSFSKDGVIPSTEEAEEVFQPTAPDSPDFDDPCLAEKGLRDLGFGYNYNMYQAKAWGYSRHRPNFSSSRHIQNSQFKKVPIASPEQDIFDDPSVNHSDSEDDKTLVSSPVDENFRPHSVPPSLGNGAVHYLSPISPHTSPNSHRSTKHSILSTPVKLHQMDQSTPKPNYSKYMSAFQTPNSKKEGVSNKNMNLNLGNSDKAMVVDLGSPTDEESVTFV